MTNSTQKVIDKIGYLAELKILIDIDNKIPESDWEILLSIIEFKSAKGKTLLLDNKRIEYCGRFMLKGVLKIIYHDTESYVFDFRKKSDFLCDIVSLQSNKKSSFSFITITDCEWIEISSTNLLELLQSKGLFFNYFADILARYFKQGHERTAFVRINDAEQRYNAFYKSHKEIIKYAKLGDIASYLNLAPQSLSRIRKNCV